MKINALFKLKRIKAVQRSINFLHQKSRRKVTENKVKES
jgi:hypothetical protein